MVQSGDFRHLSWFKIVQLLTEGSRSGEMKKTEQTFSGCTEGRPKNMIPLSIPVGRRGIEIGSLLTVRCSLHLIFFVNHLLIVCVHL